MKRIHFAPLALSSVLSGILLAGCQAQTPTEEAAPVEQAEAPTDAAPAEETATEETTTETTENTATQTAATESPYALESPRDPFGAQVAVPPPPMDGEVPKSPRLVVNTNRGPITFELNGEKAPLHTRSFLYLAKRGFYDNTVFHRREDLTGQGGWIVQGGDPYTRTKGAEDLAGQGGPGYTVPLEVSDLKHERLVLSMARAQDPNSAGSQFYITQGPANFLDGQYTVFGKVVDGQDNALALRKGDKITSVKVVEGKK